MRSATRRQSGLTLLEVAVGGSISAVVLLVAGTILRGTSGLAESTNNVGAASVRAHGALQSAGDLIRGASLATVQSEDGTPFSDGESGTWMRLRTVTGYDGAVTLGSPVVLRFERDAGATTGRVVLDDGTVPRVLAREITAFRIERAGTLFTFTCSAQSGATDDRLRSTTGSVVASPRNP